MPIENPDIEAQNQAPRLQVLLAEDNIVNQEITRSQLKLIGCSVHIANNGEEALKAVKKQNFDLILMDCHMPILDGYAATRKIRDIELQEGKDHVPIIALTTDVLLLNCELCLSSGMNDYMTKPIIINELRNKLKVWLKKEVSKPGSDNKQDTEELCNESLKNDVESPIDFTTLDELRQDIKNIDTNKIISLYLQELPNYISSLEKSIDSKDGKALSESTHKFKGASKALGAQRVFTLCIVLEKLGRDGAFEKAKPEFLKMKAECELLKPVLEEQIKIYSD